MDLLCSQGTVQVAQHALPCSEGYCDTIFNSGQTCMIHKNFPFLLYPFLWYCRAICMFLIPLPMLCLWYDSSHSIQQQRQYHRASQLWEAMSAFGLGSKPFMSGLAPDETGDCYSHRHLKTLTVCNSGVASMLSVKQAFAMMLNTQKHCWQSYHCVWKPRLAAWVHTTAHSYALLACSVSQCQCCSIYLAASPPA